MKQENASKVRMPILRERLLKLQGNLSATDFADKLGLSRQTVGFYLSGKRIPDSETLVQICKCCNVSANWLLGLSDDPSIESYTVDKLGLSPKAIERILSIRSCDGADEVLQGLNMLLSEVNIIAISEGIKKYADAIVTEKSFIESTLAKKKNITGNLPISNRQAIYLNDLYTGYDLEKELIKMHPELCGRITVVCGQDALEKRFEDIMSSFEAAVHMATGYYELLTFRMNEGDDYGDD